MLKVSDRSSKLRVVATKKDTYPLINNEEYKTGHKIVKNYFSKIFDTHFLNFINHRKQRDYSIFVETLKNIAEDGKFSKDIIKKNGLSEFFTLSGSKLSILDGILPMNKNEDVLNIEKEIEILKAMLKFYNDNIERYFNKEVDMNLISKAKKIQELNDNKMLSRISSNKEFCDRVVAKLPKLKTFEEIKESKIFYDYFAKEIRLIYSSSKNM